MLATIPEAVFFDKSPILRFRTMHCQKSTFSHKFTYILPNIAGSLISKSCHFAFQKRELGLQTGHFLLWVSDNIEQNQISFRDTHGAILCLAEKEGRETLIPLIRITLSIKTRIVTKM